MHVDADGSVFSRLIASNEGRIAIVVVVIHSLCSFVLFFRYSYSRLQKICGRFFSEIWGGSNRVRGTIE